MKNPNPPVDFVGRNTVWGIRERVAKNLEFLHSAREANQNAQVHIVTELITSPLGLIVFPYQEIVESGYTSFKNVDLDDLVPGDSSIWYFTIGSSKNLHDHIRHLRNALSHRRIYFSSDSRKLKEVEIRFHDRQNAKANVDWEVTVAADDLKEFVLRFSQHLQKWEKDYS